MKVIRAARFAGVTALAAGIYMLLVFRPVYLRSVEELQQEQIAKESLLQWGLGGWLWLLAILAWMIFLAALMHSYSPVHRISSIIQSGLLAVSATLLILGILVSMNRFGLAEIGNGGTDPTATLAIWRALIDQFGMTILEAGLAMGGGLTAWICVDLAILGKLPGKWMASGAVAGILALPSPLLLPESIPLMFAFAAYCFWCLLLAIRTSLPAAYPDYS